MNKNSETLYLLNKLSLSHLSKEEFIGLLTLAIYSKEIFHKNQDLDAFTEGFFKIKYKPYVLNSRTLICARLMRDLSGFEENKVKNVQKDLRVFFKMLIDEDQSTFEKKKRKESNANKDLTTWIAGILGKK